MATLRLTAESRELDDLMDDKHAKEDNLNHEWLKPSVANEANFYATHKKSTKIIKTIAMILGCSSMVSKIKILCNSNLLAATFLKPFASSWKFLVALFSLNQKQTFNKKYKSMLLF